MLRCFAILGCFVFQAGSPAALAMNWEGHEDGPSSHPYDTFLLNARPDARPLPSADCPVTPDMVADNPYLQIPLPRHGCPPEDDKPETGR